METRSFERANWFKMVALVAVTVILCLGIQRAMAAPEQAPAAALYAITWNEAGITTDTDSTAYLTQHYAYHDFFCSVDIHDAGGVTITVQSSPAGTTYYDTYELGQFTSDTDVYTRVVSYGRYEMVEFDVQGTGLITPTCKSVYFNNWTPAAYCEQKQ